MWAFERSPGVYKMKALCECEERESVDIFKQTPQLSFLLSFPLLVILLLP